MRISEGLKGDGAAAGREAELHDRRGGRGALRPVVRVTKDLGKRAVEMAPGNQYKLL